MLLSLYEMNIMFFMFINYFKEYKFSMNDY